ncbi:hypothetical protein [Amycolatopsis sp. cmx-4-54]|uniref:hypothetical protein n=1 Tax=Amycolatopsis sp. cmx-4-54 TaxID=2790936 RepID=UPI00397A617C
MVRTSPTRAAPARPSACRRPVGAAAARLLYADDARRLSDFARRLVATERDHAPGDYVHEALLVLRYAERLAELGVVVKRTRGAT